MAKSIDSVNTFKIAGTGDEVVSAVSALTDSSGGTAAATLSANAGKTAYIFHVNLANLADGDIVTTLTPGFAGRIVALDFFVDAAVTTAAKLSTLNVEIGTTNTTGGALALTSANCTPKGVKVAGSAITAANTFTASDTISIEAASTTTFVEGSGWIVVTLINDEVRNNFASLADLVSDLLVELRVAGVIPS